jgi:ABC-type cobalamin/Fe3+-siderophores transport system ATPase subunit
MSEHDLAINEVRVRGGGRLILDISRLEVRRGEVLGLAGPNGAGKTTLLRLCLGMRRAEGGTVGVFGLPLANLGPLQRSRVRRRIGYVPQDLAAHSTLPLTVREVVAIGRTGRAGLFHPLGARDWHLVDEWIERLGLANLRDALYSQLSGGEQRKALLAKAMVQEPEMLLLDEPAAHLDLAWREQIVGTLDQLYAAARPTMVIVCHELEVLPACCRRLAVLERGRILQDGPLQEVLTDELVGRLYGPGLRVLHAGGRVTVVPETIVSAVARELTAPACAGEAR